MFIRCVKFSVVCRGWNKPHSCPSLLPSQLATEKQQQRQQQSIWWGKRQICAILGQVRHHSHQPWLSLFFCLYAMHLILSMERGREEGVMVMMIEVRRVILLSGCWSTGHVSAPARTSGPPPPSCKPTYPPFMKSTSIVSHSKSSVVIQERSGPTFNNRC